jgi:hypothetical protein
MKNRIEWEEINISELLQSMMREDEEDENMDMEYKDSYDKQPDNPIFHIARIGFIKKDALVRIMHTNFNITRRMLHSLESVDGIDGIYVVDRYKAIISFGKLFDPDEVKIGIKRAVDKCLYSLELPPTESHPTTSGVS